MTKTIRVVWKDNNGRPGIPTVYRNVTITRYKGGWVADIPNDDNIYATLDCAKNAVDQLLGGNPRKTPIYRMNQGIRVVGKKSNGKGETA